MDSLTFSFMGLIGVLLLVVGCASTDEDRYSAAGWIGEMDAKPTTEQVPHWDNVRALMVRVAPRVGDPAPDFGLKTRDGKETVRLSEFGHARPADPRGHAHHERAITTALRLDNLNDELREAIIAILGSTTTPLHLSTTAPRVSCAPS